MVHKLYDAVRRGDLGAIGGEGDMSAALSYAPNRETYAKLVSLGADEIRGFAGIVASGNQELVSFAMDNLRNRVNFSAWLALAARYGNPRIVDLLAAEKHGLSRALRVCVFDGENKLEIASILMSYGAKPDRSNVLSRAARVGDIWLINKLASDSGSSKLHSAMLAAIRGGALKSVEVLSGYTPMRTEHYDEAVEYGDPDIIKFVQSRL